VYGLDTSHQAWTSLAARYASESKSRVSHLKRQLQSLQQGRKTCIEYLKLAKELADELAAVRKPVEDDDLISFVVSGLNSLFNTFVTVHSFTARNTEMSFANFQSELLNHEMLLENQQHKTVTLETGIFALYTNKQGPSNFNPSNFNPANLKKPRFPPRLNPRNQHFAAKNNNGYSPSGNGGYSTSNQPTLFTPPINSNRGNSNQQGNSTMSTNQTSCTACQICGKSNHTTLDCDAI
jgi:hypothetical protein